MTDHSMQPHHIEDVMFNVVIRGYSEDQVDDFLDAAQANLTEGRPPLQGLTPQFRRVLRGYDCDQVDAFVRRLADYRHGAAPSVDRPPGAAPHAPPPSAPPITSRSAIEQPKGLLRRLFGG